MTNEKNDSFGFPGISYFLAGALGFLVGGRYVGNLASKNIADSSAYVFQDEKGNMEKMKLTINSHDIYLIKPQGYTNFVSAEFYKTNELGKLENKLNTEVNAK
jgi:hypothetical protein